MDAPPPGGRRVRVDKLVAVIGALVLPATPAAAACTTGTAPLTVEEQRLESQAVPGQILARSGFGTRVTAFAAALCATTSYTQATQVVTAHAGQLDDEIRRGNPSGAAALSLYGQVLTVNGVRIQVQTVVFPVRYGDFDRGIVEETIRPHIATGVQRADAITTVSQGRSGFDLEVFNGRRRSVDSIGDNNNVQGGGAFTAPTVFPGVGPGPEFLRTSLPLQAMQAVGANPFPININPPVWEIPAGGTGPQFRPDGPTAGSIAVEGSGGGYLSNEVAYRNTLLLAGTAGAPVGGRVHTPTLGSPADPTDITDPGFEQQRTAIVRQVRAIVARAAA